MFSCGGWQLMTFVASLGDKILQHQGKKKNNFHKSQVVPADSTAQGPLPMHLRHLPHWDFPGFSCTKKLGWITVRKSLNQAGYLYKLYVYLILKILYVCVCIYIIYICVCGSICLYLYLLIFKKKHFHFVHSLRIESVVFSCAVQGRLAPHPQVCEVFIGPESYAPRSFYQKKYRFSFYLSEITMPS